MAEKEATSGGAVKDLLFIVLVLLFVAAASFLSGAAQKANVKSLFVGYNPTGTSTFGFINAPSVDFSGTGGTTGGSSGFDQSETNTITNEVAQVKNDVANLKTLPNSPYVGKVSISSAYSEKNIKAEDEYVILRASSSNKSPVVISNWRLESAVSMHTAYIGTGVDTYNQTIGAYAAGSIVLQPGDEAVVSSGRSPVGASFRVNKCSGYLSQYQQFSPSLYTNCPQPEDELNLQPNKDLFADNDCYDHLASLQTCHIDVSPPTNLSQQCRNFIYNRITYNGCVVAHKFDKDFENPQWRIFLGYDYPLWRDKREAIALIDAEGRLVDSTTY